MFRERVIVLKKQKYGDADLILQALTQTGAKQSYIAKSALKSKKRFPGGVLEPTHYIEVMYKKQAGEEKLQLINEAHLIKDFPGLRTDYDRLQTALFFLQLVEKTALGGELHSEQVFNLLGHALLQAESSADLQKLRLLLQVKFLHFQGVLPADSRLRQLAQWKLSEHEKLPLPAQDQLLLTKHLEQSMREYLA